LLTVWIVGPVSPPIYDGLPIGTPPYRYLVPPKGSPRTPPPSSFSTTVTLADEPGGVSLTTQEPKPQADVSIPTQLLDVPEGITQVKATVAPVLPPSTPPPDGRIDGNVYLISVTTLSGQPLMLKPGAAQSFQVELRGTGSSREPRVEQYAGGAWTRVPFVHPASGIFQFHPSQPGEFALVLPPGYSVFGPGVTSALVVGGAVALLGLILGIVRRRRSAILMDEGYEAGVPGGGDDDSEVGAG
jgi:hypothetical protein